MFFVECPKGLDGTSTDLIIEPEGHVTTGCPAFTVDGGPEAVAILNSEHRVDTLNVPIVDILRKGDQPRAGIRCTRFKSRIADFEHKASGIAVRTWAGKCACPTRPGRF